MPPTTRPERRGSRSASLEIALGQYSDRGRKPENQDFHGAWLPQEPLRSTKGVAIALADGISSSPVSRHASEAAVTGFLEDYYCTPESWSVKQSAQRVIQATNSWLHAQTRKSRYRYERDRGYVCTFSALVLKAARAHLFHVGDARIYRLQGGALEQLTEDHRVWLSGNSSYLGRALGVTPQVEIDYRSVALEAGDTFLLMTDGVYEFVEPRFLAETATRHAGDPERAARLIAGRALEQGSDDNLTLQIVHVESVPERDVGALLEQVGELPLPPLLEPRATLDGYRILRRLHAGGRSHVYLAQDEASGARVVLKTPSLELREDPAALERFLLEEWIARRIDNPHVLRPVDRGRPRSSLYSVMEYIEGQTLRQWMLDHPRPDPEQVRDIVGQIAQGLYAFHRLEMLHQDLRPDNIMIDRTGQVRIIDFGAVRVEGITEMEAVPELLRLPGTVQYMAPEYLLGEPGTVRSELYSLGVIAYQLLSGGALPYGTAVARAATARAQRGLLYTPLPREREVPAWMEAAIRKAVHPDPARRYEAISEFVHDLRRPNPVFLRQERPPLLERDPVAFWRGLSLLLLGVVALLLYRLA